MAPWRIVRFDAVGSTNDEARRLADAGDPGHVAVVAARQTAGRGRLDRAWNSEPGGLYLSALLKPRLPAAKGGLVPLAAGLAVAQLAEGLGLRPSLRWPNDVDVAGRKVAGVLCEARIAPQGDLAWVVVGMGVNAAQSASSLALLKGTTLSEAAGRPVPPASLERPLLEGLDAAVALAERDPPALLAAWSQRCPALGQGVALQTVGGPVAGTALRVDTTGALVVRTTAGEVPVRDPDLVRLDR